MLYIKDRRTLNFDLAIDAVMTKISDHYRSFVLNTEFGKIFFEVRRQHHEPIYRFSVTDWKHAPINRYTESFIRREDISHHITIAKVNDSTIQRVMVTTALTEVFLHYISGGMNFNRDAIDAVAILHLRDNDVCDRHGSNLVTSYLNTLQTGIVRKKIPDETVDFIRKFFTQRVEMSNSITRKVGKTFDERGGQSGFDMKDDFYNFCFFLVFHEKHMTLKRDTDTFELYKELKEDTEHILTPPDFMRALVMGIPASELPNVN